MRLNSTNYIEKVKFVDGRINRTPISIDKPYPETTLHYIDLLSDDIFMRYELRLDFDQVITEGQFIDRCSFLEEMPNTNRKKYKEKIKEYLP